MRPLLSYFLRFFLLSALGCVGWEAISDQLRRVCVRPPAHLACNGRESEPHPVSRHAARTRRRGPAPGLRACAFAVCLLFVLSCILGVEVRIVYV